MSIFQAVLFAALLHACWNAIIKFGDDKFQGMLLLSFGHIFFGLFLIALYPVPDPKSWLFLLGSVLCHLIYKFFLKMKKELIKCMNIYMIKKYIQKIIQI